MHELDALRGLAAATVVVHHWRAATVFEDPVWYVRPFVAGHEAVILFFVLSGYVLSLPSWTQRTSAYPEYLVRRFARIYLPFLAAAVLSALGCWFFLGSRLPLTPWFLKTWQTPFSAQVVVSQLLMSTEPIWNTAFWSLRYEMEMSILFPLLCWLILKSGRHSAIGMVVLLAGISAATLHGTMLDNPVALGVYFAIFFVAGAALARERRWIAALMSRLPTWLLYGLFSAGLILYFESAAFIRSPRITDLTIMLGALIIIALAPQPRLRVGLRTAVSEYLGKISYSLYLVHGTVLFTVLNLLYYHASLPVLAAIYGVVSVLVAHLFHLAVEDPSLRLGKKIARDMRGSKARRVAASGV